MQEIYFYVREMEEEKEQYVRYLKELETEHQSDTKGNKDLKESYKELAEFYKECIAKRDRDICITLQGFKMMENDTKRKILLLRSRHEMPFDEIGDRVGYCETHCKRLYKAALAELEEKGIVFKRCGKKFIRY